jgi:Tfp pilus assembly protein PilO
MMKNESAKTALAVFVVIAIAGAFWLLLLSPKRDKANELKDQAATLTTEVESARAQEQEGLAAKKGFGADYAKLVQLGKAVPSDAATSSLLIELEAIGTLSKTDFKSIVLSGEGGAEESEGGEELPPLGAKPGPSGFLAMPYELEFEGGFFDVAAFIHKLDSLVQTKSGGVDAKGRLVTVDGFELSPNSGEESGSGRLSAHFTVNTYVTPPGQGLTSGATVEGPTTASFEP